MTDLAKGKTGPRRVHLAIGQGLLQGCAGRRCAGNVRRPCLRRKPGQGGLEAHPLSGGATRVYAGGHEFGEGARTTVDGGTARIRAGDERGAEHNQPGERWHSRAVRRAQAHSPKEARMAVQKKVDVVTVGAGWTAAMLAWKLTAAGYHVVSLEQGPTRWANPNSLTTTTRCGFTCATR